MNCPASNTGSDRRALGIGEDNVEFLIGLLGIIGGGLVAWTAMEISPAFFIGRLQETIAMSNFWVGLIKAPFFAFVIAIVGCFQGMEVAGSSESLGQRTTLSVVQSLFLVIILDAFFAMFFLEIDFLPISTLPGN